MKENATLNKSLVVNAFVGAACTATCVGAVLGAMIITGMAASSSLAWGSLEDIGAFFLLLLAAVMLTLLTPERAKDVWVGVAALGAVVVVTYALSPGSALVAFAVLTLIYAPLTLSLLLQVMWSRRTEILSEN